MKLRKMISYVVAGALAASAMTVTASAAVKIAACDVGRLEGDNYIYDLVEEKLDYSQARSAKITIKLETEEAFGGCIMLNGAKCGWVQNAQGEYASDDSKTLLAAQDEEDETIYTMTVNIPANTYGDQEYAASVDDFYAQIFVQEWWGDPFTVKSVEVFNESGKPVDVLPDPEPAEEDDAAADDDSAVDAADADAADDDADADADDDEDADTDADDDDEDADADDDTDADADDDDADDDTDADDDEPEETTEAPAAGNTEAPTAGGSKDSPDTGAADVAVVAGLAVVAAGAALVARKRK